MEVTRESEASRSSTGEGGIGAHHVIAEEDDGLALCDEGVVRRALGAVFVLVEHMHHAALEAGDVAVCVHLDEVGDRVCSKGLALRWGPLAGEEETRTHIVRDRNSAIAEHL